MTRLRNLKFSSLLLILITPFSYAQTMTYEQVLQRVVDYYPSLKTAAIQTERAKQEYIKVQSQLGWQLGAQAGITHDVSLFGVPTDTINLGGSLSRQIETGGALSFSAGVNRDDADSSFSPSLPNPATRTSLDVNYRLPFGKGSDNPVYAQALISSKAGELIAEAQRRSLNDQLAGQLIDVFIAAATTQARIKNVEEAIKRSKRLQAYIKDRAGLGLSEEKDVLQVKAQLVAREAELRGLEMLWQQQRVSINRLMGMHYDNEINPSYKENISLPDVPFDNLLQEVNAHNPSLLQTKARLQLADSAIELSRDARKDQLDLVMFLGNRTNSGDTVTGSVDDSEVVGGLRVEFNRGIDRSGYDAELYQAQLDRGAALEDQKQIMQDLGYDISSLLAEIKAGTNALAAYELSVRSEQAKLKEAEQRYRAGRTDTDQLIQFESQLSAAELALELQRIELARRDRRLSLLRGVIWKNIQIPNYDYLSEGVQQ
ncbi:MAG TPA: TolC family protein [Gammaproteobacteria bacterium]